MSNPLVNLLTTNNVQTIVVNTTAASGPGSLAQALVDASANDETIINFDESLFDLDGQESRYAIITLDGNLIPSNLSKPVTIGNNDATKKVYIDFSGTYYICASNNFKLTFKNIVFARTYRENNSIFYYSGSEYEKELTLINCAITCADTGVTRTFINGNSAGVSHFKCYIENCIFHLDPNGSTQQTTMYVVRGNDVTVRNSTFYASESLGNTPFDISTVTSSGNIINYIPSGSISAWTEAGNIVSDETDNIFIPEAYGSDEFVSFNGALSKATSTTSSQYTTCGTDFWGVALSENRNYGAIEGEYNSPSDSSCTFAWDNTSGVQNLGSIALNYSDYFYNFTGYGFTTWRVIPEVYHYISPYSIAGFTGSQILFVHPDSPEKNKYVTAENTSNPSTSVNPTFNNQWSYSGGSVKQKIKITYDSSGQKVIYKIGTTWGNVGQSGAQRNYSGQDELTAKVWYGPKSTQEKEFTIARPDFHSKSTENELDLSDNTSFCAIVNNTEYSVDPESLENAKFIIGENVTKISGIYLKTSSPPYNNNKFQGETGVDMTLITYEGTDTFEMNVDTLIADGVVLYVRPVSGFIARIFGDMGEVALYAMGTPMTVQQSISVFG